MQGESTYFMDSQQRVLHAFGVTTLARVEIIEDGRPDAGRQQALL